MNIYAVTSTISGQHSSDCHILRPWQQSFATLSTSITAVIKWRFDPSRVGVRSFKTWKADTVKYHPKPRSISTILVVDDEPVIAFSVAEILKLNGFHALSFVDPLLALDEASKIKPDLLISDVMMPELSGVELAIRLKKVCPECKVLLFSGQAHTDDLLRGARESGYEFNLLPKPVPPQVLLSRVNEMAS